MIASGILAISTGLWGQQAKNGKASDSQNSGGTTVASQIRRVVTGKDASGKSIAITDGAASNAIVSKARGTISTLLWVTDSTPADVSGNKDAADRKIGVPPPVNGTIFRVIEFAPQKSLQSSYEDRVKIMREMGLGPEGPTREHPRDAGMHRTRTIDYVLILSGEIDMLMDDSEVHLRAGDVLVQRATNHAWVNRGDKPCKVAFVLVDAKD
jgi:mannose-6-phosphate isomerase-like protein (cupin superfamily)